jgi:cytochrome c oxidase subunit II
MEMGFCSLLAATENLSIFDPSSPSTTWIRHLFVLVLVITGGIFIVVEGVLLFSIFRFGRKNVADKAEPPQVYGSRPIEIAWTAAPALIVFLLSLILIRTEFEVRVNPDKPPEGSEPLYVTVIGHQWWWEYRYDTYKGKSYGGFTTANELHIPASDVHVPPREGDVPRPVYLTLLSADVCHSFWVPRLAGKTDLIPGRENHMWFQTNQRGLFLGQCAEYCGTQHANMLLRVIVDSPEGFQVWLDREKSDATKDTPSAGRDVFFSQSCINCHTVRGTNAKGTVGPDLTHVGRRETLASGMVPNSREELSKWLDNPQKIKPGCLMAPFGDLGKQKIEDLTDYLLSLK